MDDFLYLVCVLLMFSCMDTVQRDIFRMKIRAIIDEEYVSSTYIEGMVHFGLEERDGLG